MPSELLDAKTFDYIKLCPIIINIDASYSSSLLPSDQIVVEGTKITFSCFINSKEFSDITWRKDGRRLDYRGFIFDNSTRPISEILVIDDVSVDDGGVYVCVGGSEEEHNATLTVIGT